jgi:chemotaxis protein CheD
MTQHTVGIADLTAGAGDITLVTIGLGSCVAIALHDRAHRVGALAHVLLPHHALTADTPSAGKAASTAVPAMLSRMRALGATHDIEARLVGGASMFAALLAPGAISLGARNVQAARAACAAHDIPIVGEAVGGDFGRSVYFEVCTGRVRVRSVRGDDVHL